MDYGAHPNSLQVGGRDALYRAFRQADRRLPGQDRRRLSRQLQPRLDVEGWRLANQLGQDTAIPMLLGRLVQELHQVALNNHGANADANIIIRDIEARSATRIAK